MFSRFVSVEILKSFNFNDCDKISKQAHSYFSAHQLKPRDSINTLKKKYLNKLQLSGRPPKNSKLLFSDSYVVIFKKKIGIRNTPFQKTKLSLGHILKKKIRVRS